VINQREILSDRVAQIVTEIGALCLSKTEGPEKEEAVLR
jgi:hypothetical protein